MTGPGPVSSTDPTTPPTMAVDPSDPGQESTLGYVERLTATDAGLSGMSFGDYELEKELGRGGMGVVYKARQKSLGRIVALKMMLPGTVASDEERQRFRTEVEATARLQHPNIVTIHEVGQVGGQDFYSMDYIEGPNLTQRPGDGPVSGRVAARYVMIIARAMHHAHAHGILHRDLKPSNILLDAEDQPHISDFGLAKRLGGDSGQTRTGAVMGTPSYMAPEQAAGRNRDLGPACDIYSLGALLYDLLTGRPPFRAETPLDTLKEVLEKDPAPPRLLNSRIDHDLEIICLKCLEKDPLRRYESAGALADDLNRYLNGDSIRARSSGVLDRLARTLERSHSDIEFHSWGTLLVCFSGIVFLGHLLMYYLLELEQPQWTHWVTRVAQFGLMGLLFARFRSARTLLPTSMAERQLWSIWIGYLTAYLCAVLVSARLGIPERDLYPFSSILTGLAFFVMGSSYWGWCYAIGVGFFVLAWLMPLDLSLAPLLFGGAWGVVLLGLGVHLRRVGGGADMA